MVKRSQFRALVAAAIGAAVVLAGAVILLASPSLVSTTAERVVGAAGLGPTLVGVTAEAPPVVVDLQGALEPAVSDHTEHGNHDDEVLGKTETAAVVGLQPEVYAPSSGQVVGKAETAAVELQPEAYAAARDESAAVDDGADDEDAAADDIPASAQTAAAEELPGDESAAPETAAAQELPGGESAAAELPGDENAAVEAPPGDENAAVEAPPGDENAPETAAAAELPDEENAAVETPPGDENVHAEVHPSDEVSESEVAEEEIDRSALAPVDELAQLSPEAHAQNILDSLGYDPASLGFQLDFLPGRSGYLGLTFIAERRIEIYLRPSMSDSVIAHTIAHEIGHAVDFALNSREDRARWRAARGMHSELRWWPDAFSQDRATPAGDFSECFASWLTGSASQSAWGSCGTVQGLVAELAQS